MKPLPCSWHQVLAAECARPYFQDLCAFLDAERCRQQVFPAEEDVFAALEQTPFEAVKVVILGQDPYHDEHQAHGLSFSVRPGVRPPPSLCNIFKELETDVGCPRPGHGDLSHWARQGVLLLNTVLTVEAHKPGSHRRQGWEQFTDAIITTLGACPRPKVFILWGGPAQAKKKLIDLERHALIESPHPSPLSASRGFFGSRPFSRTNELLRSWGVQEIDWRLPAFEAGSYVNPQASGRR
jgi:uracil-DNA glycosylase